MQILAPRGYTFRDAGLYGFVDVLDFTGTVLAESVSIGQAHVLVTDWQTGKKNPYISTFGLDTR